MKFRLSRPRTAGSLPALAILLSCSAGVACRHAVTAVDPVVAPASLITLAAGTTLALRTAEPIDSESHPLPDRAYAAVVSRDMKGLDSQLVLPSGSPATLVLLPGLELGLSSVTLNGDSFLVRGASPQSAASLGIFLGGVPGTVYPVAREKDITLSLAALTISAAAIQISSGSLLTFRLSQPITLRDSRK